jgi:co-chaperonin GroES (HSP10)
MSHAGSKGRATVETFVPLGFFPLLDKVVVRKIEPIAGVTKSGIIIPETAHGKAKDVWRCVVLAIGPGIPEADPSAVPHADKSGMPKYLQAPLDAKPGDEVMVMMYSAFPYEDEIAGDVLLVGTRDCWAVKRKCIPQKEEQVSPNWKE